VKTNGEKQNILKFLPREQYPKRALEKGRSHYARAGCDASARWVIGRSKWYMEMVMQDNA